MEASDPPEDLVNRRAANAHERTLSDPRQRAFIASGHTKVLLRQGELAGKVPSQPFDMEFFCRALVEMFRDEKYLRMVLDGRQDVAKFWDDDD